MSKPERYRPPAWVGLTPTPRVYVPATPDLAREVAAALGRKGTVWRLENAGGDSSIFLKMDADDGCVRFVKVVTAERTPELLAAEALARWLHEEGVRVVAAESTADLGEGRRLWSYPYHCGRPPKACVEDIVAIGSELGRLHRALHRHPSLPKWQERTAARLTRLSMVRMVLADGTLAAGPEPALLQRIAFDQNIDFLPNRFEPAERCLALHGDLNRFNMLIDGQGCTFLDFEDVSHSVLPAIFDLATVVERVVMVDAEPSSVLPLAGLLFDSYAAAAGCRPALKQVPDALRGLALRALCTLAEIDPAGRDDKEWRKFFRLLSDVEALREIFSITGDGT